MVLMKKEKHPIMRDSFRSLSIESKRKRKGPSSRWKYAFWPAFIALSLGITDYISRPSKNLSNHITKYEKTAALERISDQPSLGLNKDEWDEYAFISKYRDAFRNYAEKSGQPEHVGEQPKYAADGGEEFGSSGDPVLDLALKIDSEIKHVRPDGWRGVQAKEQVIKAALYRILQDEDEVERIFQPFFRGSAARSSC